MLKHGICLQLTKINRPGNMDWFAYVLMLSSAILWGATDALMKYFSPKDKEKTSSKSGIITDLINAWKSLFGCPAYLLCLLINQVGSVLYYWSLAVAPLSLAVPAVNTGKFLVNALVGRWLGEGSMSRTKLAGLALMAAGILLQITA